MALCSMVGGGTNLNLCASLLVEGTRGRSWQLVLQTISWGDDMSINLGGKGNAISSVLKLDLKLEDGSFPSMRT